jgi:hypothetical protein
MTADSGQRAISMLAAAVIFTALLKYGRCSSQECFPQPNCQGESFPTANANDCCVWTEEGASFSDGGHCSVPQCIVHGFQSVTYVVNEGERLDTRFGLNVKGITRFPRLLLTGILTAVPHTARSSDFEEFSPILTHGNSEISLLTVDDGITLEYDDSVILTYTPQTTNLTDLIASAGEFVRDNATLIITDNDRLEIYFEESEYTVREDEAGVTPVHLKLRKTQNPFVLTLRPMSIDDAESVFNVGNFINSDTIMEYSRATPGMD